jgi:hypothetical protein
MYLETATTESRVARGYIFIPKYINSSIFWRDLEIKKLEYLMAI